MNKLDSKPLSPAFAFPPILHLDPNPGCRLIVLFPASETDSPELARRIWEIARSLHLNVLLVSLSDNIDEEAQLRRKLITMSAIIKDPSVSADIMIERGNDWVGQVKKIWQTGDILACYAGQKVGLMRKPLEQILKSSLEAPIYILSDSQPAKKPSPAFISQVSSWLGSLALIGGFLWAEVKIVQLPRDWAHTALLYFCVVVEIALIWAWNSIFE